MIWFWILLGFAVIFLAFVAWRMRFRRARLRGAAKTRAFAQFESARKLSDPARRVVEADIVLDHALKELGYSGSLGEKLKTMGVRFSNVDAIWRAHKLRNRIAHEPGVSISDKEAEVALRAFEKALKALS
jgi:hypothetical protein